MRYALQRYDTVPVYIRFVTSLHIIYNILCLYYKLQQYHLSIYYYCLQINSIKTEANKNTHFPMSVQL